MTLKQKIHLAFLSTAALASTALTSCDNKMYEECPSDRMIDEWGVVDKTRTFGEYDSLYYIVNPIANVRDTVYYNGNYTDSYYHSDPVRVMLRYTVQDSIEFNLDRLYTTEMNPMNVIMLVRDASDTLRNECVLYLRRGENQENLYKTGPDSLFKEMLRSGHELKVTATNGASSSNPQGSQNYEFSLYTAGFEKAMAMADSLNRIQKLKNMPEQKKDTVDKTQKHHKTTKL